MRQQTKPFSPLRAYLWPIHGFELRKFLPLLLLAFFIGFNYNILRTLKDTLLVTAESSGAEVLPFIKVWGIVPGALLMLSLYSRLNNRLTRERVFYVMISVFVLFFTLFTFVVYPLRDVLHPHTTADRLQEMLPAGFMGLIAMFRYWTFSSFYIMSELWSSAVLSMLFWGFANEITKLGEAKRFYGLIAIGLNLAAITSGQCSYFLSGPCLRYVSFGENCWEQAIVLLTCVILFSGVCIMLIYRYLSRRAGSTGESVASAKQPKIKMSMRKNFAYLSRHKYLLYIALIVLSYNLVINLVEVIWKDQVRNLYPDPNKFNGYMSQVTTITGVISFFTSLLISGQLIRRFGWTFTALATPIVLLITSIGFFTCFFGKETLLGVVTLIGTSPLAMVAFFGSAQNCLCRAAKFTLFDATKEMAFIPLDRESQLKGKAAIDGVGSRIGKSGGSLIHQGLLLIFSTIAASAHIVAAFVFAMIGVWIAATVALGRQFKQITAVPEPAPESATPEPSASVEEEELVSV